MWVVGMTLALGACAHAVPSPGAQARAADAARKPVMSVEDQRARNYMTTLIVKKNRFLLANGYSADGDAASGASATAACALIAYSQWAVSVDPGTFDVFTRTMERCYGGNEQS